MANTFVKLTRRSYGDWRDLVTDKVKTIDRGTHRREAVNEAW